MKFHFIFSRPPACVLLGVSHDVMSFNFYSLADWFKVMTKSASSGGTQSFCGEAIHRAVRRWCRWSGNGVTTTPAVRLIIVRRAPHPRGDLVDGVVTVYFSDQEFKFKISLDFEAGVSLGGSDYFILELRGKLWRPEHRESPPARLVTIEVTNSPTIYSSNQLLNLQL